MGFFSTEPKKYNLQEIEFEITNLKTKIASTKVNHILHLLLCIPTAGFWIIPWILITISASGERSGYEKSLKDFYQKKNTLLTKKENQQIQNEEDALERKEETQSMDNTEKLIKLSEMLEKGLLTEEEFKQQKEKLL